MSSTTVKQIAALQDLPMPALQERWRSLLGTEPPRYNRSFLVRRLAHRLQDGLHPWAWTEWDAM